MPQTKNDKRVAAEARQAEYDKLTLEEKLERALRYGSETSKQAVKLRKKIDKVQEQKKDTPQNRKPHVKRKRSAIQRLKDIKLTRPKMPEAQSTNGGGLRQTGIGSQLLPRWVLHTEGGGVRQTEIGG